MLTDSEVQRIADEHALSAYPFRCRATRHLELDDPPVTYFRPTPPADTEGSLFGVGTFVVNRVTGKVTASTLDANLKPIGRAMGHSVGEDLFADGGPAGIPTPRHHPHHCTGRTGIRRGRADR
jgi:hypothetical protein